MTVLIMILYILGTVSILVGNAFLGLGFVIMSSAMLICDTIRKKKTVEITINNCNIRNE